MMESCRECPSDIIHYGDVPVDAIDTDLWGIDDDFWYHHHFRLS